MKWHRHSGIEVVHNPPSTRRAFLYETPVLRQDLSKYLDYKTDNELAVSLSLCRSAIANPHYPELLAKCMVWLVKHLCERTDMMETRVGLRLGITDDMRDVAMPYLEACQFPFQFIDWFESREPTHTWSAKYDAMRQSSFASINKILHFDLTLLIGTHPTQRTIPLFSKIRDLWKDRHIATGAKLIYDRHQSEAVPIPRIESISRQHTHKTPQKTPPVWQAVSAIFDTTAEKMFDFWTQVDPFYHIPCTIIGFHRDFLNDEAVWQKIDTLLLATKDDEATFALYIHHTHLSNSDLADISEAFPWGTALDESSAPLYTPYIFVKTGLDTNHRMWLAQHQQ